MAKPQLGRLTSISGIDMVGEMSEDQLRRRRIMSAFVKDGKIEQIPASHGKRLVLLEMLAQEFEPGVRYPESEVNEILLRWHPDYAAWRRYLIDAEFLDREGGFYWRCGGQVEPLEAAELP
jgi:hypothetical protein